MNENLKSILFVGANPRGTRNLRLEEEKREIAERLRLAGYGRVPINSTGATRPRDIQQAMLDFRPQIVHFSGHGAEQDGLVFEDASGQEKLVKAEPLANLFKLFSTRLECVVLSACYSEFQAEPIARHINYVVGMNRAIGDRAAIEFAFGFYSALGAGESIEFAYELGCIAIQLEGIAEQLTPVLFQKGKLLCSLQNKGEQLYAEPSRDVRSNPIDKSVSSDVVIEHDEIAQLILQFLKHYSRWFFNASRIQGWGAERPGYESFSKYSTNEIDQCLQRLFSLNKLRVKTSKKGTTLYTIK
jgi:hypothetical protein